MMPPHHVSGAPNRQPGRSFDDPSQPLGAELLDASPATGEHNVADRAKAIGVLAKAEELMANDNPPPSDFRRALELACGRVGVQIAAYDKIVAHDEALQDLQERVLEAATARGRVHDTGPANLSQAPMKG